MGHATECLSVHSCVSSCQLLYSHQDPAQIAPTLGSHPCCSQRVLRESLWVLSTLGLAQYQIFGNGWLRLRGLVAEGGYRGVLGVFGLPRCVHGGVWICRVEADWVQDGSWDSGDSLWGEGQDTRVKVSTHEGGLWCLVR